MIWESYYWKSELNRIITRIESKIHSKREWSGSRYGAFEKDVMIGFYIIRKLMEAKKLPNKLVEEYIKGSKYQFSGEKGELHIMNDYAFNKYYDFSNPLREMFTLAFLYNQIIHSYFFVPIIEDLRLVSILFNSDKTRDQFLYEISIGEFVDLFKRIATSNVVFSIRNKDEVLNFDEPVNQADID